MQQLIMAAQLIAAFSILVTLHELGHYLAARMFGIKVEKFYLFFDAWNIKLFKFKKGDTEYGIGWLPFGGYVKIAGMVDESLDTEQLKKAPEPWEFRSKPAWQRLIVMLGGIIVNLILGILLFILHTWYYGEQKLPIEKVTNGIQTLEVGKQIGLKDGDKIIGINGQNVKYYEDLKAPSVFLNEGNYYDVIRGNETIKVKLPEDIIDKISDKKNSFFDLSLPCVVDSILKESAADKIGLQKNDQIIAMNDTQIQFFTQFYQRIANYSNKTIQIKVLRGNDTLDFKTVLEKDPKLGFYPANIYKDDYVTLKYSFSASIPYGIQRAKQTVIDNVKGLKKLVSGKLDPRKSIQSPIGIASMFGAEWIWERFWILTALLSLVLAIMNLLPIPALDGGHVVFLLVEMITRRPLSEKFMQVMQVIGMVILLSLMAFAFGNDLFKIFFK